MTDAILVGGHLEVLATNGIPPMQASGAYVETLLSGYPIVRISGMHLEVMVKGEVFVTPPAVTTTTFDSTGAPRQVYRWDGTSLIKVNLVT